MASFDRSGGNIVGPSRPPASQGLLHRLALQELGEDGGCVLVEDTTGPDTFKCVLGIDGGGGWYFIVRHPLKLLFRLVRRFSASWYECAGLSCGKG